MQGAPSSLGEDKAIGETFHAELASSLTDEREYNSYGNNTVTESLSAVYPRRVQASATQATNQTVNARVNGYIGCYVLPAIVPYFLPLGTVETCKSLCAQSKTLYAALSNGNKCYCIDDYGTGPPSSDSNCTTPCASNPSEFCGGSFPYVGVYLTGK